MPTSTARIFYWKPVLLGLVVLASLISVTFAGSHSFGQVCFTVAQERGRCVPVKQCESVRTIMRKKVHTHEDIQFIYHSQCGRSPEGKALVCCVPSSPLPGEIEATQDVTTNERVDAEATRDSPIEDAAPGGSVQACGLQLAAREINTENVSQNIGFHPWSVLLHYGNRPYDTVFSCSGTLISPFYVLTTASCVDDATTWVNLTARLGEYDIESAVDCLASIMDEDLVCAESSYDVKVAQVLPHERYGNRRNDIALLRLSQAVQFTDWVAPICLPATPFVNETVTHYAASWNQNTCDKEGSRHKTFSSHGVTNRTACRRHLPQDVEAENDFMCVSSAGQRFADAGGALTVTKTITDERGSRTVHELAGVLSGTSTCANYDGVLLYTKVGIYLDWIKNKVEVVK